MISINPLIQQIRFILIKYFVFNRSGIIQFKLRRYQVFKENKNYHYNIKYINMVFLCRILYNNIYFNQ